MRAEYAIDVTRRYALFVNAPEGRTVVKVTSGPHGVPEFEGVEEFTATMMKGAKNLSGDFKIQALSAHYYTFPVGADGRPLSSPNPATGFSEDQWVSTLRRALQMEPFIKSVSTTMDKYDPEKKIALALDEWGALHAPEPGTNPAFFYQQSSLLDAEVAALTLNAFQRHTDRLRMANIAQMVNVAQALILTDKEKILLTPTYHVFAMYQPFQDAVPYPVEVSDSRYDHGEYSLPAVDVSAARGLDGKLHLALVNVDPHRSAEVETNLTGRAHGLVLTGATIDTHNTFESPEAIRPVPFSGSNRKSHIALHLPAKSACVVVVD